MVLGILVSTASLAQSSFSDDPNAIYSARPVLKLVDPETGRPRERNTDYQHMESELVVQASAVNSFVEGEGIKFVDEGEGTWDDYQDEFSQGGVLPGQGFHRYRGGTMGQQSGCDASVCYPGTQVGCLIVDPCTPFGWLATHTYLRAEYVNFFATGQTLPVLAGAGPTLGNQSILFGGREVGNDGTNGIRFETGLWLDDCRSQGVMVRMFDTGRNNNGVNVTNLDFPAIVRPFIDAQTNDFETFVVSAPGGTGMLNARVISKVNGGDILWRQALAMDHLGRWDLLVGYQTARLTDRLLLSSDTVSGGPTPPAGTRIELEDRFMTRNQFHGFTLGVNGEVREGNWFLGGMFKLGMGNMNRMVDISGDQTVSIGGLTNSTNQGLLARNTNSGRYESETFVFTPELNLLIGYSLTHSLDFTVGYSFLRLPKVARSSETIDSDLAVNLSDPLVGPVRPEFGFSESNLSLHGLNLGLQWRY